MDTGWQSGGGRIVATFHYFCSVIWSGSPATESIQNSLENIESLQTSVDEDIDPLEKDFKENNYQELGEEDDFGDEASTVASATSDISSVNPIQQNLLSTSTTIQPSSSENSNKTSRGEISHEKMEEMLENHRNKRI